MKIYDIAIAANLDKLFAYYFDDEQVEENLIGRRVLIPFGKSNKLITGYIIKEAETVESDLVLKNVNSILDDEPIFSDKLLEFAEWMSNYYLCGIGEVLKAALPTGMSIESNTKIKLAIDINSLDFNEVGLKGVRRIQILKELENHTGFISLKHIEKKLNT